MPRRSRVVSSDSCPAVIQSSRRVPLTGGYLRLNAFLTPGMVSVLNIASICSAP